MSTLISRTLSRFRTSFADAAPARQLAWIGAFVVLIAALGIAAYWALKPSYQVLFRDLKSQDSATIITELERQKIPFRVDATTNAILVPEGQANTLRLKMMSSDLRLQGTVGFELFNNSDLGLTDFAQKVNYQRALQGELTRTITSLEEIDMARVHLTLPESSIFRRSDDRPKASVALFMRHGQALSPDMIKGIQRLIAASVPQMTAADVTVIDQRGDPANVREIDVDDPKQALKRAIEREYERKIIQQISPMIAQRQARVSVNAELNFDQVRVTNEAGVSQPISVDSTTDNTKPLSGKPGAPTEEPEDDVASDGTFVERRLEQIVSAPGSIKRLSVGIVVDGELPAAKLNQLRAIASAAVGASTSRGDAVVVFSGQASTEPPPPISALAPVAAPNKSNPPANAKTWTRPAEGSRKDSATTASKSTASVASSPISAPDAAAESQVASAPESDDAPVPPQASRAATTTWHGLQPSLPILVYGAIALLIVGVAFTLMRLSRRTESPARSLSAAERDEYVLRLRTLLTEARGHHGS